MVFGIVQFIILIPLAIIFGVGREVMDDSATASAGGSIVYTLSSNVVSYGFSFLSAIIGFTMTAIYAKTDSVNSLLKIDNYKRMWANNGANVIILPIISSIVGGFVAILGFFALCIGIIPASVISMLIGAGFNGQLDVKEVE
ncbi:MAG: hypothetical protein QY314_03015 [Candidatus Dojkabacteria bacterium]|nr:MAG: hypothetical protein QY314_03015 [Candidatus Dojkabacteria bacterium]